MIVEKAFTLQLDFQVSVRYCDFFFNFFQYLRFCIYRLENFSSSEFLPIFLNTWYFVFIDLKSFCSSQTYNICIYLKKKWEKIIIFVRLFEVLVYAYYILYMGQIQFACYFWKREANQCYFWKTQKLEKHHYFECFFQTIRLLCMF